MRAAIAILGLAVWPSSVFGQMASIEGDVYLLTVGGEVRQGAANQVFAIPQMPEVSAGWAAICEAQSVAFTAMNEEFETTRTRMQAEIEAARDSREELERRDALVGFLESGLDLMIATIRLQAEERAVFLQSQASTTAPTGMRAHYALEVAPGRYWLFATMSLAESEYRWLVPVVANPGAQIVLDLDNNNTLSRFACDDDPFEMNE